VDDDELSCRILADVCSEFASCDLAANGREGFAKFEKAVCEGRPYDLICSDVTMPGLSGHEMVRQIRAREMSLPVTGYLRTRIFMISSSGLPRDMTQAILDNDCDDYIVKPFQRDTLKALLQKYNLLEYDNVP